MSFIKKNFIIYVLVLSMIFSFGVTPKKAYAFSWGDVFDFATGGLLTLSEVAHDLLKEIVNTNILTLGLMDPLSAYVGCQINIFNICPDNVNGGVVLMPEVTVGAACSFQIPMTFYIPSFNYGYVEVPETYCYWDKNDNQICNNPLPAEAQRYEPTWKYDPRSEGDVIDERCGTPDSAGSYVMVEGVCMDVTPISYKQVSIDETHNKIALYRVTAPISQFQTASGEVDKLALLKWFTGIPGSVGSSEHNFGSGIADYMRLESMDYGKLITKSSEPSEKLLRVVDYATACKGNVCKFTDSDNVPDGSYIFYAAKILGDYVAKDVLPEHCVSHPDGDECTGGDVSYSHTSAKFLSKAENIGNEEQSAIFPWIGYSDYSLGTALWGPTQTGTAICPPVTLTVAKAGPGTGTVTSSIGTLSWSGNTGTATFDSGAQPSLTAVADANSVFTGWSVADVPGGCGNTTGSCGILMNANRNVTATFSSKVKPACGTANGKTYVSGVIGYGLDTQCISGTSSNTTFPAAGSSAAWLCTNPDGSSPSPMCSASRSAAPVAVSCGTNAKTYTTENAWPSSSAFCSSGGPMQEIAPYCGGGECYDYNSNYIDCWDISSQDECESGEGYWHSASTVAASNPTFPVAGASVSWNCGSTLSSCSASKVSVPVYLLTVTKIGSGTGTITSSPTGISCGTDCTKNYTAGTSVTLTASPSADSTFAGWSGICSGTGTCIVTMSAAKSVTATFNIKSYLLTITTSGTGTGTIMSVPVGIPNTPAGMNCGSTCSYSYNAGTSVKLTASPSSDSTFAGWSVDCNIGGKVTMTTNKTCTATFTKILNPGGKISVTGCGISGGKSTCDTILNWKTWDLTSGVTEVTKNNYSDYPHVSSFTSGTNVINTVNYGETTFFLYHNNAGVSEPPLDKVTMTARCDSGGIWTKENGSIFCKCSPGSLCGTLTPEKDSCDIKEGDNSCPIKFTWNTQGAVEGGTISGVTSPVSNSGEDHFNFPVVSGNSGSQDFDVPYDNRTFYLYNTRELAKSDVTSKCTPGTHWDNISKCVFDSLKRDGRWSNPNCSTDCGSAERTVTRKCDSPARSGTGDDCSGSAIYTCPATAACITSDGTCTNGNSNPPCKIPTYKEN